MYSEIIQASFFWWSSAASEHGGQTVVLWLVEHCFFRNVVTGMFLPLKLFCGGCKSVAWSWPIPPVPVGRKVGSGWTALPSKGPLMGLQPGQAV